MLPPLTLYSPPVSLNTVLARLHHNFSTIFLDSYPTPHFTRSSPDQMSSFFTFRNLFSEYSTRADQASIEYPSCNKQIKICRNWLVQPFNHGVGFLSSLSLIISICFIIKIISLYTVYLMLLKASRDRHEG